VRFDVSEPGETNLGSVFADDGDERPRGPDLRVSVEVPRAALGASLHAPVPPRIAADGELVERAVLEGDDPACVVLHLPEHLPERAVLRLRGQGGVLQGGQPGDLFVKVELVDRPPRDGERIVRSEIVRPELPTENVIDTTWWWLLGLAAFGAAVLVAVALAG
jgi:hypothetical protein